MEYQIQLNNIKNSYENSSKEGVRNVEKELDELKIEIQSMKSNNKLIKNPEIGKLSEDKEIELRCYSNEDSAFCYIKTINLKEKFSNYIDSINSKYSIDIKGNIFKYDGKIIDKEKSLIENRIFKNSIIIMQKGKEKVF